MLMAQPWCRVAEAGVLGKGSNGRNDVGKYLSSPALDHTRAGLAVDRPPHLIRLRGAETDGSGSYVLGPTPVTNRMPVSGGSWTLCNTVHAVPGAPACA
jgi:hypothetical protein